MDLLRISNENKLHYVYIKEFNRFMYNKTKWKNKKLFCRYYLQNFSSDKILTEHKEICLKINGKQTVKFRKDSIKFKNYFKQLAVLFEVYADFECILKKLKSNDKISGSGSYASYTEKCQSHIVIL